MTPESMQEIIKTAAAFMAIWFTLLLFVRIFTHVNIEEELIMPAKSSKGGKKRGGTKKGK